MNDHELAAHLADAAGRVLISVREELVDATGEERKRQGDAQSQAFLAAALAEHRPYDAVLSEEAVDDLLRLESERVWIIDPLDGTREFSELGRVDWAVHVALWARRVDGGPDLVAGAVALPAQRVVHHTGPGGAPLAPAGDASPRVVVSRTRPPAVAVQVRDALGGALVELGSAGAKVMSILQGSSDIYVHAGGQYEWDSAAPVAVARAAGLHTSRIDGTPLVYNRADPLLPDLLVCRPEFARPALAAIAEAT